MSSPRPDASRALVLVGLGAASISFAPILVKAAVGHGVGPTAVAMWRVLIAASVLLSFAALRWGRRMLLPRRVLAMAVITGVTFAADLWVWHRAIVRIGAGMATILGNTQVFWTALLGRVLFAEPLTRRFAAAAAMAFAGVALLAGVGSSIEMSADYLVGVGLGLATGVAYGAYIITLRHSNGVFATPGEARGLGPLARAALVLAWVMLVAGVLLAAIAALEGHTAAPPDTTAWLEIVALALGVQIAGWVLISSALPRLPAARGALMLLLQPTLAAVWGALIFAEDLAPLQLCGAALTLGGVYLGSAPPRR